MQESVKRGNSSDDVKSASGKIYAETKKLLGVAGMGNNSKAFMRSTLAPLIHPDMDIYKILKKDIFGQTDS